MKKGSVNLTAKWQLDAALLSRPVDLTALVTMSRNSPDKLLEDNTLHRLVNILLNEKNSNKSDKDTKLDVLSIMANVAASKKCIGDVRSALQGISEWFDEYIASEERIGDDTEPELHKGMVLLLARCWEYKLKTEDVLELTQGDRRIALYTCIGLLEDGETYSTELKQRQKPGQGKMGQWEHELVCQRYEQQLLLQICRLIRGFTHPGTYFEANDGDIALYSVEKFAEQMDSLLEVTLRSRMVEKLSVALYDCLFEQEEDKGEKEDDNCKLLEESDHLAVASVHAFLQNLYFYASENNEEFRRHMLMDTLLIPRLIIPYLDRCVIHARILNSRAELFTDLLEGDRIAEMTLHNPQLVKGIAASLRTLIIASFRAPSTQFVMSLLRCLNPTIQILQASAFCRHHEYIFALLCLLNVNMGALDMSSEGGDDDESDADHAYGLLHELATIYSQMDKDAQSRVCKRVMFSGALPISRDTPSYAAIISVLDGGVAGQLEYSQSRHDQDLAGTVNFGAKEEEEREHIKDSRSEVKRAQADRLASLSNTNGSQGDSDNAEPKNNIIEPESMNAKDYDEKKNDSNDENNNNGNNNKIKKKRNIPSSNEANDKEKGFRLLGDLPSLNAKYEDKEQRKRDVKVALNLELPTEGKNKPLQGIMNNITTTSNKVAIDSSIPSEFLCSINGHVMKEPVRAKTSGLVFERATIELWLSTRGSVCPITNEHLTKDDLESADDLRNKIKKYHIQQTALRTVNNNNDNDDLYDF